MIQTLFLAKQDYDKRRKAYDLPAFLDNIGRSANKALAGEIARHSVADVVEALRFAGFTKLPAGVEADLNKASKHAAKTSRNLSREGMWFEAPQTPTELVAAKLLAAVTKGVSAVGASLSASDRRLADYIVVRDLGFPAYAGGPFAVLTQLCCGVFSMPNWPALGVGYRGVNDFDEICLARPRFGRTQLLKPDPK